ncbi:beta-mannosidase [Clostridium grantii]|uniref:Beta-mannosidase B n=1 Tax=Clostridium grantii DSM 8605 TaxID=1121316 RepID=A0A1M5UBU5_9CLOT|nr:glycoside hydrolase family 2 protein [Clostridium grantii]SHH60381.1 beta-mannosidase [Clostridium grantii DSM 8605]
MRQIIKENWKMRHKGTNEWTKASVPGSVYNDLLNSNKMEDPYWRENEYKALDTSYKNFEYETSFDVNKEILTEDRINLIFEGIDTISEIHLNGIKIADTNNMHRTYFFNVKEVLKETNNKLLIKLFSPSKFVEDKYEDDPLWGTECSVNGYPHLRKAHYMFGWDWGPKLPDMGIWRNVYLESFSVGKIEDVYITQKHLENTVQLSIEVEVDLWDTIESDLRATITSKKGDLIIKNVKVNKKKNFINLSIENPEIWWPNNLGDQPLYDVEICLMDGKKIHHTIQKRIGLRTLTVKQEKDQWGESFEININGISIFAMGADYIPEDNILSRCNKIRTEELISDCVKANMNCIRVWGGGCYPEDYFFDLCDEYGLIVWQDLMYACGVYRMTEGFTDNIINETRDNVKRLRHHASLGLWCGNNEMETAFLHWQGPKNSSPELKTDYIKQFEIILPQIVKEEDPNTFYWKSSPSSGGHFYEPNDENKGDVHDWNVWHGQEPFTYFQEHFYRFLSEFGLQSFPNIKTIESFTLPEDRNIFSAVMENHQKNDVCNAKILHYIAETYRYPKNFESLVYASQLIQAEGIKYAVEHLRRHRGRCMGAIYWQLNDSWPVASWSSIDYYGRWKALHYAAKKFFAPILISAEEIKRKVDPSSVASNRYYPISEFCGVKISLTNDTIDEIKGKVVWNLRDNYSKIIKSGEVEVKMEKLSAESIIELDFSQYIDSRDKARTTYVEYSFIKDNEIVSKGNSLFVKAKHFEFIKPELKFSVTEEKDNFKIEVSSQAFAKYVEIELVNEDCTFSDNYFDIEGNSKYKVECNKNKLKKQITLEEFKKEIRIKSIIDIS